ncbi:MAG: PAS domain S-box protein [Rhodospirillales bacterium]|nr:PAS domain S-box protein [Rhodospirillales bacterium]MDP6644233.1 PAS domain S-box protein [Rhodospirillales bacterium]
MLEPLPAAIIVRKNHILHGNRAALTLFGAEILDELTGLSPRRLILTPELLFASDRDATDLFADDECGQGEETPAAKEFKSVGFWRLDGSAFAADVNVASVPGSGGDCRLLIIAERAPRRELDDWHILRQLLENAAGIILISDSRGGIVMAGRETCRVLGYTEDEIGNLFIDQIDCALGERDRVSYLKAATSDDWAAVLTRFERKHGSMFPVEVRNSTLNISGEIYVISVASDISEWKRTETRLKNSEQRFHDFASAAADRYWETDQNHRFAFIRNANPRTRSDPPEHWIGKTRWELLGDGGGDDENWRRHRKDLQARRAFRNFEFRMRLPGGRDAFIRSSGIPIFDEDGQFVGYRGINIDITAEMQMRAEAATVRERFLNAMEKLDVGFVLWNADNEFVACNEFYREICGDAASALVPGLPAEDFVSLKARNLNKVEGYRTVSDWLGEQPFEAWAESTSLEYQLIDGRWLVRSSQRLADGGLMSLHTDITEQKSHEIEVESARQSAEFANRAKSEFLANMSHELRTPLNAIIGFSEALGSEIADKLPEKTKADYIEYISSSGQHLLDLINDLLDVSAIEEGQIELSEEVFPLANVAESAIRLVAHRAETNGIELCNEIGADSPFLVADKRRVKQILVNLLSNAVKFTPQDGRIVAACNLDNSGNLEVTIEDSGIGMDRAGIELARKRFGQVPGSDDVSEGTGLGLPLSIRLAEIHGGSLDIESTAGKGTKVTVTFPAKRVRVPINLQSA